jgi:hypothetical protein
MTKDEVKKILDRVLSWAPAEQEKVARFARDLEQRLGNDISDEEWKVVEQRAAQGDLASDQEVERVFGRYRRT